MREAERLSDAADQGLEDLVGPQRGRHFLEDVEQQVPGAQRVAGVVQVAALAEVRIDPGSQLAEVDGRRHRVLGSGLERVCDRVGPAVGHEHDHGRASEPGCGREVAHLVYQTGILGADREHHYVRRLVPRPVGAGGGGRVGRFGNLEATAHQEPLEAVRAGPGVADEEDALLALFRQRSRPRRGGSQAIVHPMGRQPRRRGDGRAGT